MGRSQGHKVFHQGRAANGEWVAQGQINPVVAQELEDLVQGRTPVINFFDPDYAAAEGVALSVLVLGQNFDATCVVNFAGLDMTTTFGSATELTFDLDPADFSAASHQVHVKKGPFKSNTVLFGLMPAEAFHYADQASGLRGDDPGVGGPGAP